MGLIKFVGDVLGAGWSATKGAVQSATWKEYFESGDMSNGVLMKRAQKILVERGRNRKADTNLISSGSGIDVQEGQCMIIVENGRVVEFCAEAGRYTYDASIEPSLLSGQNKGLKALGREIMAQWSAGGQRFSTQRVYFINMGEIIQCPIKWGCGDIAFHHTQRYATGVLELDITLKGNGLATIHITDPERFFKRIGAQHTGADNDGVVTINDEGIMTNLRASIVDQIAGAIATLGTEQEVSYTAIRAKSNDIKDIVNNNISEEWAGTRGFELASLSINGSFRPTEDDLRNMKEMERNLTMTQNANMMNYDVQKTIAGGFKAAGENGSFGNAAHSAILMSGMGGMQFGQMQYQQNPQQQQPRPTPPPMDTYNNGWTCACGTQNDAMFCKNCGSKKPVDNPVYQWQCSCGSKNQPDARFCVYCGTKREVVKKIVCDKCGWKPTDQSPVRFCPVCGDIIDSSDYQEG
jgi:membrane protease subunit (stomatin/prohibitin family)